MQIAINAANRARLISRPNPWVGAVVVAQTGEIFEGSTSRPGGPHAEINALTSAGKLARGATREFASAGESINFGVRATCATC